MILERIVSQSASRVISAVPFSESKLILPHAVAVSLILADRGGNFLFRVILDFCRNRRALNRVVLKKRQLFEDALHRQ